MTGVPGFSGMNGIPVSRSGGFGKLSRNQEGSFSKNVSIRATTPDKLHGNKVVSLIWIQYSHYVIGGCRSYNLLYTIVGSKIMVNYAERGYREPVPCAFAGVHVLFSSGRVAQVHQQFVMFLSYGAGSPWAGRLSWETRC